MIHLCFHGIWDADHPPQADSPIFIQAERFEALLDAIAAWGDASVSFDDGNDSDLRFAVPALLRRGMRAGFFINTSVVGSRGYLTAAALRAVRDAGMWIGSHGRRHLNWRTLAASELRAELEDSRKQLADWLGADVTAAACPYGEYDRRVVRAVRQAGYESLYLTDPGPARRPGRLCPRMGLHDDTPVAAIARWRRRFGRGVGGLAARDPAGVLRELFTALGVDPAFSPASTAEQYNQFLYPRTQRLLRAVGMGRVIECVRGSRLGQWIKNRGAKQRSENRLAPHIRQRLAGWFRDDVQRLQGLLNRDLSAWLA